MKLVEIGGRVCNTTRTRRNRTTDSFHLALVPTQFQLSMTAMHGHSPPLRTDSTLCYTRTQFPVKRPDPPEFPLIPTQFPYALVPVTPVPTQSAGFIAAC